MRRAPRGAHHDPGHDIPMREVPLRDDPLRDDPLRDDPLRDDPLRDDPLRDDPLRRLSKSMLRCGLAMGLMGWEAATGSSPRSTEARRRRFDDAAHAAEGELGEYLGEVYRAGVRAGDRMIDGMAELGSGTPLDPRRFARAVADLAQRTGDTLESMAGRPRRRPSPGRDGAKPAAGSGGEAGRWP